ncbi:MAG: histone deacetylase, partial [Candidatus Aureabacteria bacterium]|nr:histone deacetylase [Candidatus Auribacterota bacterium]
MTEATTALVCSDAYLRHDPGPNAEEVPGRITAIVNAIKGAGIQNALLHLTPTPASIEAVLRVHDRSHVGAVREACARAPAKLDRDTYVSKDSYEVALLAAGGVLNAAEAVMRGEAHNAFCVVRPPGHHATPTRAMGFCLFNNVAIAARHLQQAHGIARVLIVDWDAHHGNGTQEVFYDDPGVLYFSTHQFPCYPGTGGADERGTGAGIGFTINVPMPAG